MAFPVLTRFLRHSIAPPPTSTCFESLISEGSNTSFKGGVGSDAYGLDSTRVITHNSLTVDYAEDDGLSDSIGVASFNGNTPAHAQYMIFTYYVETALWNAIHSSPFIPAGAVENITILAEYHATDTIGGTGISIFYLKVTDLNYGYWVWGGMANTLFTNITLAKWSFRTYEFGTITP